MPLNSSALRVPPGIDAAHHKGPDPGIKIFVIVRAQPIRRRGRAVRR